MRVLRLITGILRKVDADVIMVIKRCVSNDPLASVGCQHDEFALRSISPIGGVAVANDYISLYEETRSVKSSPFQLVTLMESANSETNQ